MEEYIPRELFTKKHLRLTNLATIANVLFWIILIFTVLSIIINIRPLVNNFSANFSNTPMEKVFQGVIMQIYNMISGLIDGFVTLLVLKSIHLSLNMIVETDINYRMNKPETEESDEE